MATTTIRDAWVGQVINGRFPLLEWLGGTAWGGVFLTEIKGPDAQKAVIKLVPAKDGSAKAYLASWAAAATLSHPHLMRLLDTGRCEIDGQQLLYAVTDQADEVLSEIIPERALEPEEAREMLVPVLDALSYLHGKGYAHGHLKPSNIMAVANRLKLSVDSLEAVGEPGDRFRALDVYDAPERASGVASTAADVWSLGMTLVETLTQRPPKWDRTSGKEPVIPRSMPEPFARIAWECLRLDPAQRCSLAEVSQARSGQIRAKKKSLAESAEPAKRGGIRPGLLAMAGAVVVLAIVAIVVLQLRSRQAGMGAGTGAATQQAVPKLQPAPVPQPATAAPPATQSQPPETGSSEATGAQASGGTSSGSEPGSVADRVMPDVPQRSLNTIHGKVKVEIRVAVDTSGNVTDARFKSAGPSRYFANLALQAARKWRFNPPETDGKAVESVWLLRFEFQRTGAEVAAVETTP
jgi:TonB family protein